MSKLLNHPEYKVPLPTPPPPSNPNALRMWRQQCNDINEHIFKHNNKLFKTIEKKEIKIVE